MSEWTKGIRGLVGFLTIIPVTPEDKSLENAAKFMFLFPIIGGFIGALVGAFSLLTFGILPALISGLLTVALLSFLTGLHHIDGLLDFGDGLMVRGPRERKIQAMKDPGTGVGGWTLGTFTILGTIFAVSEIAKTSVFQSLIAAEVAAKFAMVVLAFTGKLAYRGSATPFVEAMRGRNGIFMMLASLLISTAIVFTLHNILGVTILAVAVGVAMILRSISHHSLGGINGDVFGSTNELARVAVLVLLAIFK